MSNNKTQTKFLTNKRFKLDWDSSDDDSSRRPQPFHSKKFSKNPQQIPKKKIFLIPEEQDLDSDDEQDLTELFSLPRKHIHKEVDSRPTYCHQHGLYRVKPVRCRHSYMLHESGEEHPELKKLSKNDEELYIDEDSGFEYLPQAALGKFRPFEFNYDNCLRLEDYLDFKNVGMDLWQEETMEDSNYIKDAKPYLDDSDREDGNSAKMTEKFCNTTFTGSPYTLIEKLAK